MQRLGVAQRLPDGTTCPRHLLHRYGVLAGAGEGEAAGQDRPGTTEAVAASEPARR